MSAGAAQVPNQRQPTAPAFEVASVKPMPPDSMRRGRTLAMVSPGHFRASNATLVEIMERAFDQYSRPGLIAGGPGWIRDERWEINAKTSASSSRADERSMLQRLLTERFQLKTHTERRPVDVYALVTARTDGRLGPRLRPTHPDCVKHEEALRRGDTPSRPPHCEATTAGLAGDMSRTRMQASSLAGLAAMLQRWTNRAVIDRTGLTGAYDYDLEFDFSTRNAPDAAGAGVSLFTAVQEQLGLRLDARREMMDVLVIDTVERPAPD
jgi:uncharacterized protein (TIGR03435 family)